MAGSLYKVLWRDRRVRAILALALVVRLLLLGYLAFYPNGIFAKGDSWDYQQLTQYLIYYHSFGREDMSPSAIQKPVEPPSAADRGGKLH